MSALSPGLRSLEDTSLDRSPNSQEILVGHPPIGKSSKAMRNQTQIDFGCRNYGLFVGLGNPVEEKSLQAINVAIETIAKARGLSMAQITLAWQFHQKAVSAPIVSPLLLIPQSSSHTGTSAHRVVVDRSERRTWRVSWNSSRRLTSLSPLKTSRLSTIPTSLDESWVIRRLSRALFADF